MDNYNHLASPYPIDNPNNGERHEMLKYILKKQNRIEDFEDIINLMSPPEEITKICAPGLASGAKVAVIGAGESGLAATLELKKIGCNITLFEATSRIGGRVFTYYFDRGNKYFGELGPMSIPVSHETTWHYINLFNIYTSPFGINNENSTFYLRDESATNDNEGRSVSKNIYPKFKLRDTEASKSWRELENTLYEKYFKTLTQVERKELIQVKKNYSDKIKELDILSYRRAYEQLNLSEDAITMIGHLNGKGQFFKLGLTEILKEYYTADEDYTYKIDEGMIKLSHLLYEAICGKIENPYKEIAKEKLGSVIIKTSSPVSGIYHKSKNNNITLKFKDNLSGREVYEEFDYVICAIPFSSLRRIDINPLFTVRKMQAINEMNYEVSQKIYMFLKERFWEKGGASKRIIAGRTTTDLPLTCIYYPSDHAKAEKDKYGNWVLRKNIKSKEPGVLLASFSFGQDAMRLGNENPELQLCDIMRYIEKIHNLPPQYLNDKIIDFRSLIWSDVQYIWSGGALSKPEDKTLFSYEVTLPEMHNRVFFAGEHISQKHVTQQGALQSGMVAANEVAKQIVTNIKKSNNST